jgi:hypothetical protein
MCGVFVGLVICGWGSGLLCGADKQEILSHARAAYYDLKKDGLVEFRCEVDADWEAILKSLQADPADPLAAALKQTHFTVVIGPDGVPAVSRLGPTPADAALAERFRTTAGGMEQVLTGFFQVWAQSLNGLPGPRDGEAYGIEQGADDYRILQTQGEVHIAIAMNRKFLVTEIKIVGPNMDVALRPRFAESPKGFLFAGYGSNAKVPGGTQEMDVTIEEQAVEGFELPALVTVKMGNVQIPLHFTGYRIKKR